MDISCFWRNRQLCHLLPCRRVCRADRNTKTLVCPKGRAECSLSAIAHVFTTDHPEPKPRTALPQTTVRHGSVLPETTS